VDQAAIATLIRRLAEVVGDAHIVTGESLAPWLRDARGEITGAAVCGVRPGSTAQVAAVVRTCAQAGVAVVTQGGATGMSGGAVPFDGRASVVVQLGRLDDVTVDAASATVTVGAGATIEAVQSAAADVGLAFPPDWGARGTATVGGAIATNAGGVNVLRHGPFRDHVLGLEVVLADGRVLDTMRALRKNAAGLDLRQLFIGTEGTLGIVTAAVLGLSPDPGPAALALLALPDLGAVDDVVAAALPLGFHVDALELLPGWGIARAAEAIGQPDPTDGAADWHVLIQTRGTHADDELAALLSGMADAEVMTDAVVAGSAEHSATLWAVRDALSPTQWGPADAPTAKADVAVPVRRIGEYLRRCTHLVHRLAPEARPLLFGHLGDGNVHTHVVAPAGTDPAEWAATADAVTDAIDELAVELGGTISAEHGIGRALVDRIERQQDPLERELARRIAAVLDPDDLLNPGKVLPER